MNNETLRFSIKKFAPETALAITSNNTDLDLLDKAVVQMMTTGSEQYEARPSLAKGLLRTAANRAARIFEAATQEELQPYQQRVRAMHGELAVIGLMAAGDKQRAIEVGQVVTNDRQVPIATQLRVYKLIEHLKNPYGHKKLR